MLQTRSSWLKTMAGLTLLWLAMSANMTGAQTAIPKDPSLQTSEALTSVFSSIYEGNFDYANKVLGQLDSAQQSSEQVRSLRGIIDLFESIAERRRRGQVEAFDKEVAKLEELKPAWLEILKDPETAAQREVDPNDPNAIDPNNTTPVLAVIANMMEYATDAQKQEILADSFVNKIFERSAEKAAEHEAKGEWIDAYSVCYAWLKAIDPNNKAYSDYAEELLEKATIAASFEDSPCETSQERYNGVKARTFVTVIHILSVHYVNAIDYKEMALKALKRCRLLSDVVQIIPWEKIQAQAKTTREAPDPNALSAWAVSLLAAEEEIQAMTDEMDDRSLIEVFENVLKMNKSTAELPDAILITQFAEAALGSLDPHTIIIWPKQVEDFNKAMTSEFTGIGIEISKTNGKLTVAGLLLDTPAYKAGLDAGDVIIEVDGLETKDMSLHCAVRKITGPKGTEVTLTIEREGETEPLKKTLVRDHIIVPTIRGWQRVADGSWRYMIDPENRIGYVRITSFAGDTAADLEKVLIDLEQQGLKGLVLDLRWNTGGLLNSAVAIVDKFISSGLVVWTQPGYGRMPDYSLAHKEGTHPDYPIVVLINGSSASASEIVSGALGDPKYERAVLVGERTHGKGSVQVITEYKLGGAQLKYTMAYYHLPSGQRVNSRSAMEKIGRTDWGIGPDIEVKLRSDEIRTMLEIQKKNDVLVQADHDEADDETTKHSVESTLESDPQLAVGLLVVQTKLAENNKLAWHTN